mgnify:CR=1 FL=1
MNEKFINTCKILSENLEANQTQLSKDPVKAKREKQFLVKLAILGTAVGVATSAWQLLRDPGLRKKVTVAIKRRKFKPVWKTIGVPLVGGAAVDIAAEPATGWVAQRWQDMSDKRKKKDNLA